MIRSWRRLLLPVRHQRRYLNKITFGLLLCLLIIILCFSSTNSGLKPQLFEIREKFVQHKKDLVKTDITKELQIQYDRGYNLEEGIRLESFVKENVVAFVSNLDIERHKRHSKKHSSKKQNRDDDNIDVIPSGTPELYDSMVSCDDLKYENELKYHFSDRNISNTLIDIRRQILKENTTSSKKANDQAMEKGLTELEIVEKFWSERIMPPYG